MPKQSPSLVAPVSRPRFTTAQTLTLVTVSVVAAVLATAMVVIWIALTRSAVDAGQDRVDRSVKQLASVSNTGIRQARTRYAVVAHDPAVLRALGGSPSRLDAAVATSASAALRRLQTPADSGMPVELWSADGHRLAFVGNDIADNIALKVRAESGVPSPPPREGLDHINAHDSLQIGTLYRDGNRTLFWLVVPVVVNGAARGFIAQQRRIAANPQTEQTIRELGGNSVAGYYRSADGSVWTKFGGAPAGPPDVSPTGERIRPGLGAMLYAEEPIAGTPLVLVMEAPRDVVAAGAMATVRQLAMLSAILTIVGALLAWTIGRRVARPLVRLTQAAESVAGGDYSARVSTQGSEEISLLATAFNRMAEQIAETRARLQEGRQAAEAGSRAKSAFLASMSHELRTPLNAIGGYAELIEMGLRGPVSDEQLRDLARIRTSQQHLLGLIGRILDLSRIESGRLTFDLASIALDPFLAGLETLVHPQATAKQQRLTCRPCEPELTVRADREKLRQIMLNLLSNAIRYSPAGASITVEAGLRSSNIVAIAVRDTGPGIPSDRRELIFEPFVQLNRSLTTPSEGIGLGLAISRDLARGMNGDLAVVGASGEGACFILTLPAGEFDENTQIASTVETPAHR